jgi:hypothetical protein
MFKTLIAAFLGLAMMIGITVAPQPAKADPIIVGGIVIGASVLGYLALRHLHDSLDAATGGPTLKYKADGQARCRAEFRTYDPTTGLIALPNGQRKICPWLQ